ncbi:MAG TPA: polyprenol monophosphomannose synthase [Bacteroidetes bacterium]|nr:polyprenol monophosphomannose synthase [Bacteroidota bacterium]
MEKTLVIIPTYNEKQNIPRLIPAIREHMPGVHIMIVDDHSPDGTADLIKRLQTRDSDLFLIERSGKLGLGTAYITAFRWALERDYEYIFEMDADFSHDPADLPRLFEECRKGNDLIIGSRYVSGVNVVNWPLNRIFISMGASFYVRLITGIPVKDTTAGFVCYRRKVLEKIRLDKIKSKGYGFQIEMKFWTWKNGFKMKEIPIVFKDRTVGVSKMSGGIFNEALWSVIRIKLNSIFHKKEYI